MFSRFINKPVQVYLTPQLIKYQTIHYHYYYYYALYVILKYELL